ncbi:hypothetical protein SEA_PATELGO_101 [Streptomyces phage Patelgo]|nr:hypothetical protein SEA_PATELGO_101 [Streptomyces phage Patelgo]
MAYKRGEPVRIRGGSYRGEHGMIVKILKGGWYRIQLTDKQVDAPENELEKYK